jgi:hypothetical protein
MAEETNSPLQEMLDWAIENERRRPLLERANLATAVATALWAVPVAIKNCAKLDRPQAGGYKIS